MDRTYFDAIQDLQECAILANHIARNANYHEAIEAKTRNHLGDMLREINALRMMLQDIVNEQRNTKL